MLHGLDINHLATLVYRLRKEVEFARAANLIVIAGRAGAGKSTLLNYIMGSHLKVVDVGGIEQCLDVVEGEPVYAEIGHGGSHTLFPKVAPMQGVQKSFSLNCQRESVLPLLLNR